MLRRYANEISIMFNMSNQSAAEGISEVFGSFGCGLCETPMPSAFGNMRSNKAPSYESDRDESRSSILRSNRRSRSRCAGIKPGVSNACITRSRQYVCAKAECAPSPGRTLSRCSISPSSVSALHAHNPRIGFDVLFICSPGMPAENRPTQTSSKPRKYAFSLYILRQPRP